MVNFVPFEKSGIRKYIMKYSKEIIALTSLMFVSVNIYAAPSNEQLYQMILDLKKKY